MVFLGQFKSAQETELCFAATVHELAAPCYQLSHAFALRALLHSGGLQIYSERGIGSGVLLQPLSVALAGHILVLLALVGRLSTFPTEGFPTLCQLARHTLPLLLVSVTLGNIGEPLIAVRAGTEVIFLAEILQHESVEFSKHLL